MSFLRSSSVMLMISNYIDPSKSPWKINHCWNFGKYCFTFHSNILSSINFHSSNNERIAAWINKKQNKTKRNDPLEYPTTVDISIVYRDLLKWTQLQLTFLLLFYFSVDLTLLLFSPWLLFYHHHHHHRSFFFMSLFPALHSR